MKVLKLTVEEATDAAAVQAAIDRVAALGGGRVVLPEMTVTLDRGIELRSDVELTGQGRTRFVRSNRHFAYFIFVYMQQ